MGVKTNTWYLASLLQTDERILVARQHSDDDNCEAVLNPVSLFFSLSLIYLSLTRIIWTPIKPLLAVMHVNL